MEGAAERFKQAGSALKTVEQGAATSVLPLSWTRPRAAVPPHPKRRSAGTDDQVAGANE